MIASLTVLYRKTLPESASPQVDIFKPYTHIRPEWLIPVVQKSFETSTNVPVEYPWARQRASAHSCLVSSLNSHLPK